MATLFTSPAELTIEDGLKQVFEDYVLARAQASPAAPRTIRPLRDESAAVYRDVWHAFAQFCAGRNTKLQSLDVETLDSFVATLGDGQAVTARYVRRVLALIDRISQFAAKRDATKPSTAPRELLSRGRYRYADAALEEELPEFLNARESTRLRTFVTTPQPDPRGTDAWRWQEVRNRTAVALQLGAGITPGEVQGLKLQDVVTDGGTQAGVPWKLRLPANGNSPAHESPMAPWAGTQLARWLKTRAEANVAGDYVFASTRAGKQWSKMSCYNACQEVLDAAGVQAGKGGTYRLRHTWVLRQMANRATDQQIANWLGLKDPESVERYRRVLATPVEII
jgi:integrase